VARGTAGVARARSGGELNEAASRAADSHGDRGGRRWGEHAVGGRIRQERIRISHDEFTEPSAANPIPAPPVEVVNLGRWRTAV
jgi:hypothetical protein